MVQQHQSGRRDLSAPLWSLLMFEAFLRRTHGAIAPATPRAARTVVQAQAA
jgi:asparagine synthase (glutamine-hydrolysing)